MICPKCETLQQKKKKRVSTITKMVQLSQQDTGNCRQLECVESCFGKQKKLPALVSTCSEIYTHRGRSEAFATDGDLGRATAQYLVLGAVDNWKPAFARNESALRADVFRTSVSTACVSLLRNSSYERAAMPSSSC